MSEEEAIKEIERFLDYDGGVSISAIATLYTLYQKEKSLNKIIKSKTVKDICYNIGKFDNRFISKDKIREKLNKLKEEQKEYKGSQEWEIQDDILAQIMILEELLEED